MSSQDMLIALTVAAVAGGAADPVAYALKIMNQLKVELKRT